MGHDHPPLARAPALRPAQVHHVVVVHAQPAPHFACPARRRPYTLCGRAWVRASVVGRLERRAVDVQAVRRARRGERRGAPPRPLVLGHDAHGACSAGRERVCKCTLARGRRCSLPRAVPMEPVSVCRRGRGRGGRGGAVAATGGPHGEAGFGARGWGGMQAAWGVSSRAGAVHVGWWCCACQVTILGRREEARSTQRSTMCGDRRRDSPDQHSWSLRWHLEQGLDRVLSESRLDMLSGNHYCGHHSACLPGLLTLASLSHSR